MNQPIDDYFMLAFETHEGALAAARTLIDVVANAPNLGVGGSPADRVVLWAATADAGNRVLFLSRFGLATLRQLVPNLPRADLVQPLDLPLRRRLLLGVQRDWSFTGRVPFPW